MKLPAAAYSAEVAISAMKCGSHEESARNGARVVEWRKDLASTTSLRKWFGHVPAKWTEFRRRYRTELTRSGMMGELRKLARLPPKRTITFVYSAADEEHNQAVVLKELIDELV